MANVTFSGPVRSVGGFQSITINATTGAVSTAATFGPTTSVTALNTSTVAATTTVAARSASALETEDGIAHEVRPDTSSP